MTIHSQITTIVEDQIVHSQIMDTTMEDQIVHSQIMVYHHTVLKQKET